jgi:hypothetical protein
MEADTIRAACDALDAGGPQDASAWLKQHAPVGALEEHFFAKETRVKTFIRDGFIDRLSGARLVFPGALRLMSVLTPDAFPYHSNWRAGVSHPAYWRIFPILRRHRGELITTSISSVAGDRAELHAPGDIKEWDGLLGRFVRHVECDFAALRESKALKSWFDAIPVQHR